MPLDRRFIAGGITLTLGLGGLVTSAILSPTLVPVFVVVGTAGAAIAGKDKLEKCFTKFVDTCFGTPQPVVPALAVDVHAEEVEQDHPPAIARQSQEGIVESYVPDQDITKLTPQAVARNLILSRHTEDVSIHRHESFHRDGKTYIHDERYSVTKDEVKKNKP